jgi:hypothetical protein
MAKRQQRRAVPVSLAAFVPTHPADYRPDVAQVPLGSGRPIDRLDMSAWHEAGHAVAFLALGWSIRYLVLASPSPEGVDARDEWWAGECRAEPPPRPEDHLDDAGLYRALAVATMAGPVAARAVRIALGLRAPGAEELLTEVVNAADAALVAQAQSVLRVLGLAPTDPAEFEQALREEATAILLAHRRAYGALVEALVTHTLLNAAEVAAVWDQGACAFPGRIGRLAEVTRRADLTPHPDLTLPPFVIRERARCTGSAQSWVDAGTAASLRAWAAQQRVERARDSPVLRAWLTWRDRRTT